MTQVVHLRIKAAGDSASAAYVVETAFIRESGVEKKRPEEIDMPLALTDPGGPQALWESVRALVAENADDADDGDEPGPVMLRLHDPELRALDWEGLARESAATQGSAAPRVLRTAVGPGGFHPGEQLSFGDLPVRVLVVGTDSHVEREAVDDPPWHGDVALHDAVRSHAGRWEVDVLPGPVSHSVLAETVKASKPHVLHLAGSAARTLFDEGEYALGGLNLSSVRLVVSSNDEAPGEAHRLLGPYAQSDALTPVLAVVSLTPGPQPDPDHDLCESLTRLYGALIEGESLDVAVRSATEADSSVSAVVTVNCRPDLVLPKPSELLPPSSSDLYESLERATDRVGQRRTALEQLESGADVRQLIVLSGGEADDKLGTTWFLLSTIRVWEERPGARALYLDFGRLGSTKPPRAAEEMPQADDVVLETVALLTESVCTHSARQGGWNIDGELTAMKELVERERLNVLRDGGYHTRVGPVREELVRAAGELLVKAAPPDTHLVLALDHFVGSEKVRPLAKYLVRKLFNAALYSRSAVTVVVTAKNPHPDQTVDWLGGFVADRQYITLQRWSAHHGGPLLRELGTRMGYDWHRRPEWRELVREKLGTIREDFGPQLLQDVCDTALARIG